MGSVIKNALDNLQTSIDNIDIAQELNDLTNVDLVTDAPVIGSSLIFDGTNWICGSIGEKEQIYTTPGSYLWRCPPNVFSVCVVCVGGGG